MTTKEIAEKAVKDKRVEYPYIEDLVKKNTEFSNPHEILDIAFNAYNMALGTFIATNGQ
jgi:hypothetical protein